MSTKGLKQLSVRAKQSISTLNPFCHGEGPIESHDSNNVVPSKLKENDTPNLQEFGSLKSYTDSSYSEAHPSPAKDSPSRRKKLMGSLRSMSSLRSVRSPLKENSKEPTLHMGSPVEPESPCTPSQNARPSLALNFQQSPVGQPMFDLQTRIPMSSSLDIHHSSPVAIPMPAQQELPPCSVPAGPLKLPFGTVPASPGPLRIALEKDASQSNGIAETASPYIETNNALEPLPTPMPGTNFGFSQDDLTGDPHPTRAQQVCISDHVDYFNIPIPEDSRRTSLSSMDHEAVHPIPAVGDSGGSPKNAEQEHSPAVDGVSDTVAAEDSSAHGIADSDWDGPHVLPEWPEREPHPIDIEHIVYKDYSNGSTAQNQTTQPQQAESRTEAHIDQQTQLQSQPSGTDALSLTSSSSPGTWGTHGSLYDGTGYGDGNSSRPSTSSTAPKPGPTPARSTVVTATLFAEECAAMARDHETLEEVIRAYASFEEDGMMGFSEEILEDVVADVELANRLADHNLGA